MRISLNINHKREIYSVAAFSFRLTAPINDFYVVFIRGSAPHFGRREFQPFFFV